MLMPTPPGTATLGLLVPVIDPLSLVGLRHITRLVVLK
jgi:hypothetical protein